jgi:hypothetical protein
MSWEEVAMRRIISAFSLSLAIMALCPLTIVAQTVPDKKADAQVREVISLVKR